VAILFSFFSYHPSFFAFFAHIQIFVPWVRDKSGFFPEGPEREAQEKDAYVVSVSTQVSGRDQ